MSHRFITSIISIICVILAYGEERVSVSFTSTPLPTALRAIEQLSGDDVTINFSFRKLEDYTVTTEIIDASPLEAISQAIGFYPIKVSSHGQVITVQPLLDTDYKVSGRLIGEDGDGVDFATVVILSLPDSTVIASGVSNLRGDFVVPIKSPTPMALKASRIGYKTAIVPATAGNIGNVRLQTDPHMLKTLTAFADRKIVSTVGAVTSIQVEGTPYSEIGTLADMLPNLPGLSMTPPTVGINGISGTRYYINGREVSESTQLNMIRSDEVKVITIDKAPSAEYPADVDVVVNISTIKSPDDFINLRFSNSMQARSKLSDVPGIDFKMQLGKFTTALNYHYDYLLAQTDENYQRAIEVPDYRTLLYNHSVLNAKNKGSRLNWSGEIQFDPRNRLGLYYYFYSLKNEVFANGIMSLCSIVPQADLDRIEVQSTQYGPSTLHSGTVSYDHTGRRFTAHLAQDIAYTNPYSAIFTLERRNNDASRRNDLHDYEYFIATTNLRLGLRLPFGTMLAAGGRYSYIESNSNKIFFNGYSDQYAPGYEYFDGSGNKEHRYNQMSVTETTAQGYLNLSQRIGNFTIAPGIRYEYVDRTISDVARLENPADEGSSSPETNTYTYDRDYGKLLPSFMLKYVNGRYSTVFNYSRRMVQPTFSMLNSGLVYEDNYTYANSNPELRSTIIDEFRLTSGYSGLTFDVGYKNIKNPIAEVELPVSQTNVVCRTPINLKKYSEVDVNLSYGSSIGRLGYYAAASVVVPGWHTIDYSNQKVTFNAELNLNYKLNDRISMYTNFRHVGSCRWMVYDRLDSQIWNLGLNAKLMDNRLNINIEATDLLNLNHLYDLTTWYNGLSSSKLISGDTRGVNIRVSYTLFNKQIRTNVHRGNIDDIDRVER